jgi:S1-C subfamily serine protease
VLKLNEKIKRVNRSKIYHLVIFLLAAMVLLIGGFVRGAATREQHPQFEVSTLESLRKEVEGVQSVLKKSELESIEQTIESLIQKALPAVVAIRSANGLQPPRTFVVYNDFQSSHPVRTPRNLGSVASGIVIDSAGHILTSDRVADSGDLFNILFDDGTQRFADLIASDQAEHLAVLKLREANVPIRLAEFEDEALHQAGGWVVRLGRSPTGQRSISLGMISVVRRDTVGRETLLLDSETITEQDGSPALNLEGKISGINLKQPEKNDRQGLMIPISHALKVANRLITEQIPEPQSWIGIELQELSEDLREYFDVQQGALVSLVKSDSPALRVGLREMDLVVRLDNNPVATAKQLIETINQTPPGARLKLTIRRDAREHLFLVVTRPFPILNERIDQANESEQTLVLEPDRHYSTKGVKIKAVRPAAVASQVGLQPEDVIISVNRMRLSSHVDFQRMQRNRSTDDIQLWQIRRDDQVFFLAVRENVVVQ